MKQAPYFALQDQDGSTHSLSEYHGRWLVLYFYPKDDTPGCTKEACNFRDARADIEQYAAVVGVSKDSVESHRKFVEKYHLNFTLLSDTEHKVIEAYDSWTPIIGAQRNTFIIDPNGNFAKEYHGVDPKSHAAEIIKDLKSLQRAA